MIFRRRPARWRGHLVRRPIIAASLALAATVSIVPYVGGATASAAPANVPTTQQLAALRAEAAAVQAKLTAGTKRLDAAKANLAKLQQKAKATTNAADKLDGKLAQLKTELGQYASQLYEHPSPNTLSTVLSGDDIDTSIEAAQLLTFATSNRTDAVRQVAVDTEQSKSLRAQADQAVKQAAVLKKSVDAQVKQLQAEASAAATKLEAAEKAYEAEQRRLAAARAAAAKAAAEKAAREKAAREAAAQRARQQASLSVASCSGRSYGGGRRWGGFSDGLIPRSALCAIIGGGALRPDAAVAFNKMTQAYARAFGHPLCITASYRPYSDQVRLYRIEPSLAAIPGTSNHGWGLAVDLGCGVQRYGSAQYRWMTRHAAAYGWYHPYWALHNPFEPWHWEFGHIS